MKGDMKKQGVMRLLEIAGQKKERMLHEEFGAKWEEFCDGTAKRLIPFVY